MTWEGPVATEADVAYPMLRLDDLRVIYDREYFTRDDGKSDLSVLLEDVMVDAAGAAWRLTDVRRVALRKSWFLAPQRYIREYVLEPAPAVSFAEVKAAVRRGIEEDPFAWTHDGSPIEDFMDRIDKARTLEEVFDIADDNCRI